MESISLDSTSQKNTWCYLTKRSWWSLKIHDYPSFKPNDADLEHIADQVKQGYDQGELIQDDEE